MPLYKADPNNAGSQIPDIQGENRLDNLVNPNRVSFTKTPNYVLVNTTLTKPTGFFFGSSASFSALSDANASSNYDLVGGTLPAGTKLNIHPTAWSGSAADNGKITFVYKSGLSTGGF